MLSIFLYLFLYFGAYLGIHCDWTVLKKGSVCVVVVGVDVCCFYLPRKVLYNNNNINNINIIIYIKGLQA